MRPSFTDPRRATAIALLSVVVIAPWVFAPGDTRAPAARRAVPRHLAGGLPPAFIANRGQWPSDVRFVARLRNTTAWLEDDAIALRTPGGERTGHVRITFEGARAEPSVAGVSRLAGVHHFVRGNDPSAWQRGVPGFAGVRYRGLYPGVDVGVRAAGGDLEYDLCLAPRAEIDRVRCRVDGAGDLRIDDRGALVIATPAGELRQAVPTTWEELPGGGRRPVECRYVVVGPRCFGFEVRGRDRALPLVIDPVLAWATYLGGSDSDDGLAVDVDEAGDVTIAGTTVSSDFPVTPGVIGETIAGGLPTAMPDEDAFVARLDGATGQLVFATYLGGFDKDVLAWMQVVSGREIIAVGWTLSPEFPVTAGAYDTTYNGPFGLTVENGGDLFVTRLRADGADLAYSTFIGGQAIEYVVGAHVDATEAVALTGHVHSTDFPTTPGAFSRVMRGRPDAYVTRLDPTGSSLSFSTFFGGSFGEEYGLAVQVDAAGRTWLAGATSSDDLPTTPGAFDPTFNGGAGFWADAFLAQFDASGGLLYASYLGGADDDAITGVALETTGEVTVAGETRSPGFPTTPGAFDTTHDGATDGFVARFDPSGSNLLYSTFLGGSNSDSIKAIRADGTGAVVAVGHGRSVDFPVTAGAYDTVHNGGWDAFVARLDPSGSGLWYGTFVGGSGFENAPGIATDGRGGIALAGSTTSRSFPASKGAWDPTYNGSGDAFAARLDLLPAGATRFGNATPGCAGTPFAGVTEMPRVGAGGFAWTCGNAPPGASGALLLGTGALRTPIALAGVEVWIDPAGGAFALVPVASDARGALQLAFPLPASPTAAGAQLHAQFVWAGPSTPAPCPVTGLSATRGLTVTLQP